MSAAAVALVVFAVVGLALVVLAVGFLLANSLRRSRRQVDSLEGVVREFEHELLTPEEQVDRARRIEEIEEQKRRIHGRFDGDGT